MNEPYWEVNDDEYEVIDMEAEEKLCNELITKGQAFQVIADLSNKMSLTCYDALIDGIAKAKVPEAEPTEEQIKEYCRRRCLVILTLELFNKMKARWGEETK